MPLLFLAFQDPRATVVEVNSKAKSKWRPQALDTVVCSGGIVPALPSCFLGPGDSTITSLFTGPHRAWKKQTPNPGPAWPLCFYSKLLMQYNYFMWSLGNKKKGKINQPSPHHSCVTTDVTLMSSFFLYAYFLQSCNWNTLFFLAKLFFKKCFCIICKYLNICYMSLLKNKFFDPMSSIHDTV